MQTIPKDPFTPNINVNARCVNASDITFIENNGVSPE